MIEYKPLRSKPKMAVPSVSSMLIPAAICSVIGVSLDEALNIGAVYCLSLSISMFLVAYVTRSLMLTIKDQDMTSIISQHF